MSLKGISQRASQSLAQMGGAQRVSLIGQRCGTNGQLGALGAAKPYSTMHQRMLMPYGADAIQLVFANFLSGTSGQGDIVLPPSMYQATSVVYTGGSGYAAGDIDTFSISTTTGIAPVLVMITSVASGAPASVQIIDGGSYNTLLAAGSAPASTTGSGTGATATFTWAAGGIGMRIGIEPLWNTLVAPGGGANAVEQVSKGLAANMQTNYNLLVPSGDFLVTDLMPVDVPVGGAIGIRMSLGYNTPNPGRVCIDSYFAPGAPTANREANLNFTAFTDNSISGTIGSTVLHGIVQPIAVLGIPKVSGPTVMAIGDSRCYGQSSGLNVLLSYDAMDNDGNLGWFEKALSQTIGAAFWPFSNMSVGNDRLSGAFTSAAKGRFGRLKAVSMARPTAVYIGLNVNDITNGTTLAQVMAYEQSLIGELRGLGVKTIFTDTTDPYTTSSDGWATVANQTLSGYSNVILQRNQALASGSWATYDFFIDQRPNSESSVNSGKWAVNGTASYYTGDGLHGSPQMITLKAATAAAAIASHISI